MKRRGGVFGAAVIAGSVALVAPAAGQGKADSASLRWSAARGTAAITSYGLGTVDVGLPVTKGSGSGTRA